MLIEVHNKKQRITALYAFVTLVFARNSAELYGLFLLALMGIGVIHVFATFPRIRYPELVKLDLLPLSFVAIWCYGVVLGLARGNETQFIFTNFAGLVGFLAYYFLVFSGIKKEAIFRIAIIASLLVALQSIAVALLFWVFHVDVWFNPVIQTLLGEYKSGSSTGQTRFYSPSQLVIFMLFSVLMTRLFGMRHRGALPQRGAFRFRSRGQSWFLFVIAVFVLIFLTASKGFMFAAMMLIGAQLFFAEGKVLTFRNTKRFVLVGGLIVGLATVLLATGYANIAAAIFAHSDEGNVSRYVQLDYLLNDLTFWGNGLGAVVPGVIRDDERPYGFELSYVNYLHKFGVVSVLLFAAYLYSIYRVIAAYRSKEQDWRYTSAALGGLCYLFPSVGNPIITSPQLILLHCMSLYLIRKEST